MDGARGPGGSGLGHSACPSSIRTTSTVTHGFSQYPFQEGDDYKDDDEEEHGKWRAGH